MTARSMPICRSAIAEVCRLSRERDRRHSCAIHVLQATGDLRQVSIWLRHASITSTEVYLRAFPDDMLSILDSNTAPNLKKGQFDDAEDTLVSLLDSLRNGSM